MPPPQSFFFPNIFLVGNIFNKKFGTSNKDVQWWLWGTKKYGLNIPLLAMRYSDKKVTGCLTVFLCKEGSR